MRRPRVMVADDHRIFAEGLKRLLEPEYEVVSIVKDGKSLIAAAKELQPDVIVADISMPGVSGIEAARQILEDNPDARVVLLTMHADIAYATTALSDGVLGYVLKHSEPKELLTAIREALRDRVYVAPTIAGDVFRARRRGPRRSLI